MQAQNTAPIEVRDTDTDRAILTLLLDSPRPFAVDEVEREMANPVAAHDGLARLAASGLVHRLDGFVFPSRAAVHSEALS